MSAESDTPIDRLWKGYSQVFQETDDLTLARWLAQTLGQLSGRAWRFSHPLIGAYRLGASVAHQRQIWLKRLVDVPATYIAAPCCRAPLLPLLSRDVLECGLICIHCGGCAVPLDELPPKLETAILEWGKEYATVHAVAHADESPMRQTEKVSQAEFERAAKTAEKFLLHAGRQLSKQLLEIHPTIVWEDQDECLDIWPEDIVL